MEVIILLFPGVDSIVYLVLGVICFAIAGSGKMLDRSDRLYAAPQPPLIFFWQFSLLFGICMYLKVPNALSKY